MRWEARVVTVSGEERALVSAASTDQEEAAIRYATEYAQRFQWNGWAITNPREGVIRCEKGAEVREISVERCEA